MLLVPEHDSLFILGFLNFFHLLEICSFILQLWHWEDISDWHLEVVVIETLDKPADPVRIQSRCIWHWNEEETLLAEIPKDLVVRQYDSRHQGLFCLLWKLSFNWSENAAASEKWKRYEVELKSIIILSAAALPFLHSDQTFGQNELKYGWGVNALDKTVKLWDVFFIFVQRSYFHYKVCSGNTWCTLFWRNKSCHSIGVCCYWSWLTQTNRQPLSKRWAEVGIKVTPCCHQLHSCVL